MVRLKINNPSPLEVDELRKLIARKVAKVKIPKDIKYDVRDFPTTATLYWSNDDAGVRGTQLTVFNERDTKLGIFEKIRRIQKHFDEFLETGTYNHGYFYIMISNEDYGLRIGYEGEPEDKEQPLYVSISTKRDNKNYIWRTLAFSTESIKTQDGYLAQSKYLDMRKASSYKHGHDPALFTKDELDKAAVPLAWTKMIMYNLGNKCNVSKRWVDEQGQHILDRSRQYMKLWCNQVSEVVAQSTLQNLLRIQKRKLKTGEMTNNQELGFDVLTKIATMAGKMSDKEALQYQARLYAKMHGKPSPKSISASVSSTKSSKKSKSSKSSRGSDDDDESFWSQKSWSESSRGYDSSYRSSRSSNSSNSSKKSKKSTSS